MPSFYFKNEITFSIKLNGSNDEPIKSVNDVQSITLTTERSYFNEAKLMNNIKTQISNVINKRNDEIKELKKERINIDDTLDNNNL